MKYTLYFLFSIFLAFGSIINAYAQIISTYAGINDTGYTGSGGPATSAALHWPCSICINESGNIYFTDEENNCVRKISSTGIISTIAGIGGVTTAGFGGDGGPAIAAHFSSDWGLAFDASGNLYITDQGNNDIRKVNTSGIISSLINTRANISDGNGGPVTAAHLMSPLGITTDAAGNIYICDLNAHNIRKINASGIISQLAGITGTPGYSGDGGPATNALINKPFGIAIDPSGNLFFCDGGSNCVREITPAGIITTIAGTGIAGFSGDGGPASNCKLNDPTGVYIDRSGNILITDCLNNRIRRINKNGIINTITGTGPGAYFGDGGLCINAELFNPTNVVTDSSNNIYITDTYNNRIRKITMVLFFANHSVHLNYCQNTPLVLLDSALGASDQAIGLMDTWSIVPGFTPHHGTAYVADSVPASGTNIRPAASGAYYAPDFGFVGTDTIRVIVTNGIATDTETIYITMDPFINNAGKITGDSMVCAGSSILLSDTAAGGKWTVTNLKAVVISGVVTGEMAGTDTVIYTVANTCGHASVTKEVTVNPLPFTGAISGGPNVCMGSSVVFTDTVSGGNWSLANTTDASIAPALTDCTVNGLRPGKDTLYYTVTDSFCTARASLDITIIALPASSITGGFASICIGASDTLAGLPGGGAWSLSNTTSASFDSVAGGGVLTGLKAGADTLKYQVTNYCGTAIAVLPFETDMLPARPTILRAEGTLIAPPGYASYQWYLNGLPLAGAIADTLVANNVGAYSVWVSTIFGCASISDSIEFPGCGPAGIQVFPNPSSSVVHVTWCREVTLRLICMDGRVALTLHNANEIDLGGLANEDYILAIYDETGKKVAVKLITKLGE